MKTEDVMDGSSGETAENELENVISSGEWLTQAGEVTGSWSQWWGDA